MVELSRRERKKIETRERIYQCAMELFLNHGFEVTPVELITQKADVGKGTFYNYFPSKEAVISEYLKRSYQQMIERRREKAFSTTQERLKTLLEDWALFMMNNKELAWNAVKSREGAELDATLHYTITAIIKLGQKEREISRHFDAEFLAESLEGMMIQQFIKWYVAGGDLSREMNNILTIFIKGLSDSQAIV